MKKPSVALFLALLFLNCPAQESLQKAELKESLEPKLQKIFELQKEIVPLHPLLENLYPIAVAEGDTFLIFDLDPSKPRYRFLKEAPTNMPIPKGVRAAFPLECLGNRIACVVSPEVFDSLAGYVTIFHEFVHCFQWESSEPGLKEKLSIYRKAMEAKDYMWELNYPFPYENEDFRKHYTELLGRMAQNNEKEVFRLRGLLKANLGPENFEYLRWQEWKEGFARYMENQIRRRLNLEENHGGIGPTLSRVSFYEGGSRFIAFLEEREKGLTLDLEKLYERISGPVS